MNSAEAIGKDQPMVELQQVSKRYGDVVALAVGRSGRAQGRVRHAARAERIGQDDAAEPDRRHGPADVRAHRDRRARRHRVAAERARSRHGVPELRADAAHDGVRERRLSAADAQAFQAGDRARRSTRCSSWCSLPDIAQRKPRELSGGQQQRVALARAHRLQPVADPARRAARRARQEAARADAARDQAHPRRAGHHDAVRHPRPGRGADACPTASC